MKLVMIEWKDSCSGSRWTSRDVRQHPDSIVSVGILVKEDAEEVEIIPNLSHYDMLHQIAIPRGCIKRIRRLHI